MAVINGVVTNAGRAALAKAVGYLGGFDLSYASDFKIGEAGYVVTPSGNVPKDPDPSLTDIESVGTMYYFTKALIASDFSFISPSTIQIRCRLVPTEANDDGLGNNPRFFELGVFDQNGIMLFYATFDEQLKNATKTLVIYMQVQF